MRKENHCDINDHENVDDEEIRLSLLERRTVDTSIESSSASLTRLRHSVTVFLVCACAIILVQVNVLGVRSLFGTNESTSSTTTTAKAGRYYIDNYNNTSNASNIQTSGGHSQNYSNHEMINDRNYSTKNLMIQNETSSTSGSSTVNGTINSMTTATTATTPTATTTTTTATSNSVIVYVSQGPARMYAYLKERFDRMGPTARFFYHSFDDDCDGCLFVKGTSQITGNNLIFKHAWNTMFPSAPNVTTRNPISTTTLATDNVNVKYFVSFDDDIIMECNSVHMENQDSSGKDYPECWEEYHNMLLNDTTTDAFLRPMDKSWDPLVAETNQIRYHTCPDSNFRAMRPDAMHLFLPTPELLSNQTWWAVYRAYFYLTKECYPLAWTVDGHWRSDNPIHREYPKDVGDGDETDWMTTDILNHAYSDIRHWNITDYQPKLQHRCEVSSTRPQKTAGMNPKCQTVTQQRFQKWIAGELLNP